MDTLHGTAAALRETIKPGPPPGQAMTYVTSTFRVDQTQVRFQSAAFKSSGPMIEEGDEVVLAGRHKANGIFEALAYRNLTTGVSGSVTNSVGVLIGGLFLCALGIILLWSAFRFDTFFGGICGVFNAMLLITCLGGGAGFLKYGSDVSQAERLCR